MTFFAKSRKKYHKRHAFSHDIVHKITTIDNMYKNLCLFFTIKITKKRVVHKFIIHFSFNSCYNIQSNSCNSSQQRRKAAYSVF